jgi:hypothetical protein
MEYYAALTKKEIPLHSTAWMNLQDIMLHRINQLQKAQRLYDSTQMKQQLK